MRVSLVLLSVVIALTGLVSCGPKAFVKGDYDQNIERENLLNDQWSETDMQKVVKTLVDSMLQHPAVAKAANPPVVLITQLQNKTSEHIDTQSVMDMVRVELMKSGKLMFIDKEAREDLKSEVEYHNTNVATGSDKTDMSGQVKAEFIVNGRLDSITQEVGKDKTIYYKVTLNLTNAKTNIMVWSDNKQIRKQYKKRSVGL